MEFDLKYALKLFFANPSFVQVYFEAVANAIDAEATDVRIRIRIVGKISDPEEIEISIADNGLGFTDERFDRFKRVKEPQDSYHKGLGRLVYLQYFAETRVTSTYGDTKRTFVFNQSFDGSSKVAKAGPSDVPGTELVFRKFSGIRVKSYDDLRPLSVRSAILEQFLPVLLDRKRNKRPVSFTIELETTDTNAHKEFWSDVQTLSTGDLPEFKLSAIEEQSLDGLSSIDVSYAIQRNQPNTFLLTAASIDGRTIPLKLFSTSKIPVGTSAIFIFESPLFAGKADSARQKLVLPEHISEASLYRALKKEVSRLLSEEIPEIKTRNDQTQQRFENSFPHLIGLFETDAVGLIDRDEALEVAQKRFFQAQKQVVDSDPMDDVAFQRSLEVSARSLTEYVLYRDWVIRRLQNTTPKELEATVHDLIVPRRNRFEHTSLVDDIYRNNAWILDDKFMTFRTILSESTMNDVIRAITLEEDAPDDDGRPDISMIFSADPASEEKVDVVVVELKRRKVDDKEGTYAASQLVKRARKLVDFCPNIQRVWYYGIIEIDSDLAQLLVDEGWKPLFSRGQVFFRDYNIVRKSDQSPVPTPTFLLSFDAITDDAAARNHAFLELLKSSFKQASAEAEPETESGPSN